MGWKREMWKVEIRKREKKGKREKNGKKRKMGQHDEKGSKGVGKEGVKGGRQPLDCFLHSTVLTTVLNSAKMLLFTKRVLKLPKVSAVKVWTILLNGILASVSRKASEVRQGKVMRWCRTFLGGIFFFYLLDDSHGFLPQRFVARAPNPWRSSGFFCPERQVYDDSQGFWLQASTVCEIPDGSWVF